MLQAQFVAGGGNIRNTPQLTIKSLSEYTEAEHTNFAGRTAVALKRIFDFAEGNPFAQCLHDGATLANHKKFLALGLQFVDPLTFTNFLILSLIHI